MHTKLGVRAIICDDRGIIMVEHNEGDREKFFIFPGGGIKQNESIFEAAQREAKEETNLDVVANKLVYVRETKMGDDRGIEFYVLCLNAGGEMKLGHDPEKSQQVLEDIVVLLADGLNNRQD
ncbi:MAG: NUDIX domain-containing protein [Patescibacteria group bacterium]